MTTSAANPNRAKFFNPQTKQWSDWMDRDEAKRQETALLYGRLGDPIQGNRFVLKVNRTK